MKLKKEVMILVLIVLLSSFIYAGGEGTISNEDWSSMNDDEARAEAVIANPISVSATQFSQLGSEYQTYVLAQNPNIATKNPDLVKSYIDNSESGCPECYNDPDLDNIFKQFYSSDNNFKENPEQSTKYLATITGQDLIDLKDFISTSDESKKATFDGEGGINWSAKEAHEPREAYVPVETDSHVELQLSDGNTFSFARRSELVQRVETSAGSLMLLPEYYVQVKTGTEDKPCWQAVPADSVPKETGLHDVDFSRPEERPPSAYVTPDAPECCWKKPGPVAGPFKAFPGDGSEVTYYWYRFADQPALLNADLSDEEREEMQGKIETLHCHWTKDNEYLPPPSLGKLVELDPALIVKPPEGLEVGYVPIVTRQE